MPYRPLPPHHRVLSTGMTELDAALAVGGFPLSFLTDVVAHARPLAVARQLLFRVVAHQQREGRIACWVDVPRVLNLVEAAAHGVRSADLLVTQPETEAHLADVTMGVLRSGAVDLLVVDGPNSIPWTSPFAAQRYYQRFFAALRAAGTAVVFLRPQREGRPADAPPGSNAARYLASLRCEVRFADGPQDVPPATQLSVCVLKNQFALPFTEARVSLASQAVQP